MALNPQLDDIAQMKTVEPAAPTPTPIAASDFAPNPYLRATVPLTFQYQPDTLRQFSHTGTSNYRTAVFPSSALPTLNSTAQGVASKTIAEIVNTSSAASGLPTALSQATIPGISLTGGASATGTVLMNPVFILAIVSVSAVARVRLYSTAAARDSDISRSNTIQPVPGLANYIISDHYLTGTATVPLTFPCCPCPVGTNQDATPSSSIYYTITNISNTTATIATTLYYLPMEATS